MSCRVGWCHECGGRKIAAFLNGRVAKRGDWYVIEPQQPMCSDDPVQIGLRRECNRLRTVRTGRLPMRRNRTIPGEAHRMHSDYLAAALPGKFLRNGSISSGATPATSISANAYRTCRKPLSPLHTSNKNLPEHALTTR